MCDKYLHLINEPVNQGKKNYRKYLVAQISVIEKRPKQFSQSEINRIKYRLKKSVVMSKYAEIYDRII